MLGLYEGCVVAEMDWRKDDRAEDAKRQWRNYAMLAQVVHKKCGACELLWRCLAYQQ